MKKLAECSRRLMFLLQRNSLERDLAEEMRFHAEKKAEKNQTQGMAPLEARAAAQRQLGNATLQTERSREQWGFPLMESVFQDVRYALRGLRKAPGFTAVAILTLALGIGATTAMFSVVNAVLLRPLPFHEAGRLVHIWSTTTEYPQFRLGMSPPNLEDIQAQAHSLEKLAWYRPRTMSLTGMGAPQRIRGVEISSGYMTIFSEHPMLGRDFNADDDEHKNGDVVLLSHALWQGRFNSDPEIIGKPVTLDQKSYTVAGVMRAGFSYPEKTDVWIALKVDPKDKLSRDAWQYFTIARLRSGAPFQAAQRELNSIAEEITRKYVKDNDQIGFELMTLRDNALGDDAKSQILVLLVSVGFLLLIACANVSNLVLARGVQRRRELGVRAALGAGRLRILRQLSAESLVLALLGGAAGLILAFYGVSGLRHYAADALPRLDELHVEPLMALFALLISAISALIFGLLPALSVSRSDPGTALKEHDTRTASASGRFSLRNILVVSELALALILLTGSALMMQSLNKLLKVNTGLRTDHLAVAELSLPQARYPSEDSRRLFEARLLQSLKSRGEIASAALSNNSVLQHQSSITNFDPSANGLAEKPTTVEMRIVSPEFIGILGLKLVKGRLFNEQDSSSKTQAVLINQAMARRFFPGRDPVGSMLKFSRDGKEQYQIVGLVSDARDLDLSTPPRPQVILNILRDPSDYLFVLVRSPLEDGAAVRSALENAVWAVDKDLPLSKVQSMSAVMDVLTASRRLRTWLISFFACSGLALTLIGIYGVISYSVNQRTREMGIRMALGARRENVLGLVLAAGARLAVVGSAIGLAGAWFLMRVLKSELYEIKPTDPATLIGAALLLFAVALLACFVPARRATRVDPMIALRCE